MRPDGVRRSIHSSFRPRPARPRSKGSAVVPKPVVLIAEELSPATIDALGPDFDVRQIDGTDRPALLAALADANAVLVRSATQIDAEAIAAAPVLKVVARAGVGLDNVDIKAATTAGVMVVNAPTSNIISAAELTDRAHPEPGPAHPERARVARGRAVEAQLLHGHRALREDRRHHRPRAHRRPHRRAPARVRRARRRIRPLRHAHPRAAAAGRAALVRRGAAPERLRDRAHAQDARDHRHDRPPSSSRS